MSSIVENKVKDMRSMSNVQVRSIRGSTDLQGTVLQLQAKTELQKRRQKAEMNKIDKMFDFPLIMSICMLAMAHGSNEINVAAPLTAEIFLLDSGD